MTALDDWITELLANRGSGNVEPLRSDIDTVVAALGLLNPGGSGQLQAGSWTPTLTNQTNITASTAYAGFYISIGNIVIAANAVDIDPTAATVASELRFTLPIARAGNFATAQQLVGMGDRGTIGSANYVSSRIGAIPGTQLASLQWFNDADIANRQWNFIFAYSQ